MGWLALKATSRWLTSAGVRPNRWSLSRSSVDAHDRLMRAEDFDVGHLRQLQQALLDFVVGQLAHHREVQRRTRSWAAAPA